MKPAKIFILQITFNVYVGFFKFGNQKLNYIVKSHVHSHGSWSFKSFRGRRPQLNITTAITTVI